MRFSTICREPFRRVDARSLAVAGAKLAARASVAFGSGCPQWSRPSAMGRKTQSEAYGMNDMTYLYDGALFPTYLKHGNAMQFFAPFAAYFCKGEGLDVGCGKWPLPGAIPIELKDGGDALALPHGPFDYIASSHCLEHLIDPVAALEHWKTRLRPGGVLALYLPHPSMTYWRPSRCKKHLHSWTPEDMVAIIRDLGFSHILASERDLAWSFAVIASVPKPMLESDGCWGRDGISERPGFGGRSP